MIKEPIYRETFACPAKASTSALTAQTGKQLALYNVLCRNGAGATIALGVFTKMTNPHFMIYEYIKIGTALTDKTTELQGGTAEQILAALNDAVNFGASDKFGLIGMNCTIAEVGTAAAYTLKYYNGTSFVTLSNFEVVSAFALGGNYIVFAPPVDWAKGGLTGADTDKYYIELAVTTVAGTTPPTIDSVWLGKMHSYRSNIAAHGTIEINVSDSKKPLILNSGEGVLPYFSTAHADNTVEISYNNY